MVLDAQGNPIRQVSDNQLITAIQTLSKRNQMMQSQLMQLGMLIEFMIEELGEVKDSNGSPLFSINETKYEQFSKKRMAEFQQEAAEFAKLTQEQANNPKISLEE